MSAVRFSGVSKSYGPTVALSGLDLEVEEGEFLSLLGPSGSGKSTTLGLLAGLIDADTGIIEIAGRDVTSLPPEKRDLAMVFQNYALYPHLTVFENIAFPLEARKPVPDTVSVRAMVEAVAGTLGIAALLARYPREISGGQQQRVALGRAMVRDPKVFLLDEPLSNLDARLRIRMRRDLKALHAKLGSTIVYVTHDQSEAMTLSTRIAIFNHGQLQQVAAPATVYDRPANAFVANFVGDLEMNFLDGQLALGGGAPRFEFEGGSVPLAASVAGLVGPAQVRLGVRAEAVGPLHLPASTSLVGEVLLAELAGPDLFLTVRLPGGAEIVARADPRSFRAEAGTRVGIALDPARIHLFDSATGNSRHHGEG